MSGEPSRENRPARRRPALLWSAVMVGAVIVVVAGVVGLWVRSANHSAVLHDPPIPAHPEDTTPVAAVWNVPRIFLGRWRGAGADGPVGLDITLTIKAGKNSEEIATSSVTAGPSGARCDYVDRAILVTDTELTFAPRPVGGANCLDEGKPYAVDLSPDGSLAYSSPGAHGGTVAVTLRRA